MASTGVEEEFKVILVGESGVGKTSFLVRYAQGKFQNVFDSTIGIDSKKVPLVLENGTPVILQVWDTAGQERFRSIVERFFRAAHGVIVMYDVTNKETFDAVTWWLNSIRRTLSGIPIILVGNKCDSQQWEVIEELAQEFAEEERLYLYKCSAKNDMNVKEVFQNLAEMMVAERRRNDDPDERTSFVPGGEHSGIRLTSQNTSSSYGCC